MNFRWIACATAALITVLAGGYAAGLADTVGSEPSAVPAIRQLVVFERGPALCHCLGSSDDASILVNTGYGCVKCIPCSCLGTQAPLRLQADGVSWAASRRRTADERPAGDVSRARRVVFLGGK